VGDRRSAGRRLARAIAEPDTGAADGGGGDAVGIAIGGGRRR
jgi:hypothetical protein